MLDVADWSSKMPAENGYAGYVHDIEVSLETWIQTLTSLFIGL